MIRLCAGVFVSAALWLSCLAGPTAEMSNPVVLALGRNIYPLPNADQNNPHPPLLGLNFTTDPAIVNAGEQVTLIVKPFFGRNFYPIPDGDLAVIEGYRIHLHIVSEDLSVFAYLKYEDMYPSIAAAFNYYTANGLYLFPFTFPKAGRYSITVYYRTHYFDDYNDDVHPFGNAQAFLTVGGTKNVQPFLKADYAAQKVFASRPLDRSTPDKYILPIFASNTTVESTVDAFGAHAQVSADGAYWWDINTLNAQNETLHNNTCYVVRISYYDRTFTVPRTDIGTFVEAPTQFYIIKDDLSVWNQSWADQLRPDNQEMLYMPMCKTYLSTPVYHAPENDDEGGVDDGNTLGPFKTPFGPTVVFNMYFPADGVYRLVAQTKDVQNSTMLASSWLFRVGLGPVPEDPSPTPTPTPQPPTMPPTNTSVDVHTSSSTTPSLPLGAALLLLCVSHLLFG